jgi:ADP-ribose pyrophosphatase YjhB (NUDIX family)
VDLRRRIAAYGLCRDDDGRVLLVRAAGGPASRGRWLLPGGGVRHGEHPEDTVVREFEEETGLRISVTGVRDVLTDVNHLTDIATLRHQDRIIFDVRVVGGDLRPEAGGSSDQVAWVAPGELGGLPLMPHVGRLLGVGSPDEPTAGRGTSAAEANQRGTGPIRSETVPWQAAVPPGARRHQRFAAYGLVTDPTGLVLLTLISSGYPGAGRWHLPGGGTDFGEDAAEGLLRELVEETDQRGHVVGLIKVSHRHHYDAVGPEGVPIDWHGVRVVFRVRVDEPTEPRVVEARGSTAAAAWYAPAEAMKLPLTEVARETVTTLAVPE